MKVAVLPIVSSILACGRQGSMMFGGFGIRSYLTLSALCDQIVHYSVVLCNDRLKRHYFRKSVGRCGASRLPRLSMLHVTYLSSIGIVAGHEFYADLVLPCAYSVVETRILRARFARSEDYDIQTS